MKDVHPFTSGPHLHAARIYAGFGQVQLARLLGVDVRTLRGWERAPGPLPRGRALFRIAAFLRVRGVSVTPTGIEKVARAIASEPDKLPEAETFTTQKDAVPQAFPRTPR